MGNYNQALDYHKKALEIHEGLNDRVGMAEDYANIGVVLKKLNKSKEAVETVDKGLDILHELKERTGYHHPLIEKVGQLSDVLFFYSFLKSPKKERCHRPPRCIVMHLRAVSVKHTY